MHELSDGSNEGDTLPAEPTLHEAIRGLIDRFGNDNLPATGDRYHPVRAMERGAVTSKHPDGRIEFGDGFETHRFDLEQFEVVCAYLTAAQKGSVFVHEFGSRGISARTEFSQRGEKIFKTRLTDFNVSGRFPLAMPDFGRELTEHEARLLTDPFLVNPEISEELLSHLVAVAPEEQELAAEQRGRLDEIEREHWKMVKQNERARQAGYAALHKSVRW